MGIPVGTTTPVVGVDVGIGVREGVRVTVGGTGVRVNVAVGSTGVLVAVGGTGVLV